MIVDVSFAADLPDFSINYASNPNMHRYLQGLATNGIILLNDLDLKVYPNVKKLSISTIEVFFKTCFVI